MRDFAIAFFIPPLRFFLRRRWVAFAVNSALYGTACLFLMSIIGAAIAPFFWLPAMAHAWYDVATKKRDDMMRAHAAMVGREVARNITSPI